MEIIREKARKLVDSLPDEASRDDLMYEIYVRKKIEDGLIAADNDRLILHEEVKKRFMGKNESED